MLSRRKAEIKIHCLTADMSRGLASEPGSETNEATEPILKYPAQVDNLNMHEHGGNNAAKYKKNKENTTMENKEQKLNEEDLAKVSGGSLFGELVSPDYAVGQRVYVKSTYYDENTKKWINYNAEATVEEVINTGGYLWDNFVYRIYYTSNCQGYTTVGSDTLSPM